MGAGSDSDVIAVLIKDHREVEQLFTQIEQLGPNDSERRGKLAEQAMKKVAPTRPHPSAPDTPPLNKLAAPGAGLIDRIRDALSGHGKQ
jgi:hypothetical protein